MPDISITVTNVSHDAWTRNNWVCGAGEDPNVNWTDQVSDTPGETLMPLSGRTTAAASTEHLGVIAQDALYMTLGYASPSGDEFAVSVMRRFHLFAIGAGDEWQTWDGSWSDWNEDTSQKVWNFANYTVTATPTLTNETGAIDIVIKPAV
jgi:hypothetical protein